MLSTSHVRSSRSRLPRSFSLGPATAGLAESFGRAQALVGAAESPLDRERNRLLQALVNGQEELLHLSRAGRESPPAVFGPPASA